MDTFFDWQALQALLTEARTWFLGNVLVVGNLVQILVIAAVFLIARKAESRVTGLFGRLKTQPWFNKRFDPVVNHAELLSLPLTWLAAQWLLTAIAAGAGRPHHLMTITVSLLAAWIVIRLTSGLVRDPVWSKFIAVTAWTIAALNIVNLLDPAIGFLDSMYIMLGELRLSALTVIKGALTLAVFLWIATTLSDVLEQRIRSSPNLTPSVKVLFSKFLSISLIAIAVMAALSNVGIDMTAFTVFGGAVGVGIGFGLQKVVSNLISGLILLMDKSVKPGDIIAIGDTYGSINALGARYVSVLTQDGAEHLIPNEELITQRVENWSHTNSLLRLRAPVGVAYDCDIRRAMKLCLDAADNAARILKTPRPECLLIGFGDSSVNIEVRCWIDDPQNGIANVKSEIMLGIWDRFQEHGISIPSPKMDVHIKSAPPAFPIKIATDEH
ncbi:MAG: hypothetical protein A3G18_12460 [Rhodospirillales bacterium RIFCSPLOWO2_12_FULL_58_28]|nr:MAG: hypothetical protein A3H92_12475 [Rhodospirillales bacterium RIFCSPLOWO2_02_FULL_58_16]OHC79673.1 MAG: hypothetical protein A3G18_12460 [Rhodospirillales bacterium RIFCSPLOWO2_12_FULL_58_28]